MSALPKPVAACDESWCAGHFLDDGWVLHASRDVTVPMTAGGSNEQLTAHVLVERDDLEGHRGQEHVRLEVVRGEGLPHGAPMTAEQALQLAAALEQAGLAALASRRAALGVVR